MKCRIEIGLIVLFWIMVLSAIFNLARGTLYLGITLLVTAGLLLHGILRARKATPVIIADAGALPQRQLRPMSYTEEERPVNPRGVFKIHGSPENRAIIGGEDGNVKTDTEGRVCPMIAIGDEVLVDTGREVEVVDMVYGESGNSTVYAKCRAYSALKCMQGSDGGYYSPATEVPGIDCGKCPVVSEMSG